MESKSNRMNEYLKLLRVKHYIKNLLVFLPLFFSLSFYNAGRVFICLIGFFAFSLMSSVIYIINDIKDIERDKLHTTKRKRPLAAGTIKKTNAAVMAIILIVLLVSIIIILNLHKNIPAMSILLFYSLLNILYSFGLKNVPVVDIIILASGFVLRVIFGGLIIGVEISVWLYLVITIGAFYMGFGKRRNELLQQNEETRKVIKAYSYNFLDKNMYVCQALCVAFYSLWSIDPVTVARFHSNSFIYTIPLVFVILLKYSFNIEAQSDGDPVTVILSDKALCGLLALYAAVSALIIYLGDGK
jgi:4-hydroxybenzoate polyprenyltransferase